jgi:hypothetical protein
MNFRVKNFIVRNDYKKKTLVFGCYYLVDSMEWRVECYNLIDSMEWRVVTFEIDVQQISF